MSKGDAKPDPTPKPEQKSKGLMIGLIAGGVLLVSCCCTGVCGIGGWWYVVPKFKEAAIVGTWREQAVTFEFRADGKLKRNSFDLVYKFVDGNTIEIGPDTSGNNQLNGNPYPTVRYRAEVASETLTLTESPRHRPANKPKNTC